MSTESDVTTHALRHLGTSRAHAKDAEACGRYLLDIIRRKKYARHFTDDGVKWLATWAFHWAARSLNA